MLQRSFSWWMLVCALCLVVPACGSNRSDDDDDSSGDGDADSDADSDTDADSDADGDADADGDGDADADADADADGDADGDADLDCTDNPEACPNGYGCACWEIGPGAFCRCGRLCENSNACTDGAQNVCCGPNERNAGICTSGGCACNYCE